MPHALELPRMLRAVVPLVSGQRLSGRVRRVVHEFVALPDRRARSGLFPWRRSRLVPRFPAVVGGLNNLAEPAGRLRRVNAVGIGGRSLHVVNLPAGEMGSGNIPLLSLAVGAQNESSLAGAHQNSYSAHFSDSSIDMEPHYNDIKPYYK